jgi:hypothetical protein
MQQLDAQEDARGRINSRRWAQQEEKEERVSEKKNKTRGNARRRSSMCRHPDRLAASLTFRKSDIRSSNF